MTKQGLRILMVLDHPFPPDPRVLNEALSLTRSGMEVTVLSIGPDARPRHDTFRGIRIIRHRISAGLRNKMRGLAGTLPLLTAFLGWLIPRVFRRHPFDCLHVHDLYLLGGGLLAGRRVGVPVIADLHENWVQVLSEYAWSTRYPGRLFISIPRWHRLEKRWLAAAHHIIAVVEEAKGRITDLGVPEAKVTVVPNTINMEDFDRFAVNGDIVAETQSPFTIVYTGGIDLHRGVDTLIRSLPHVLEVGPARLVVVGEGRIRPELESLAREMGIAASVRFTGWQRQPLIRSYIEGADVCMVPHLKSGQTDAGLPHKLFHYMYMQRPVVVTDCKPVARIVTESKCGLVCKSGNPESMGTTLARLYKNRDLRETMGANGRRAVLDRYHWDATAVGLVSLYRNLAAGP